MEDTEDTPSTWNATIHVEDPDGIPDQCLWPGPGLAVETAWEVDQQIGDFSLPLFIHERMRSFSITLPFK